MFSRNVTTKSTGSYFNDIKLLKAKIDFADAIVIGAGAGLQKISEIFKDKHLETSVDEVFALADVNKAMNKVASGGSKGKTVLKIS